MSLQQAFAPALACLDLMIHRAALRLRARYELSSDEFRGLYISDNQVDALLADRTGQPAPALLGQQIITCLPPAICALSRNSRWAGMVQRLKLDTFDEQVLLSALAPHLDAKYAPLFAYLNDDITKGYLTPTLILKLLDCPVDDPSRWALSPHGRLRQLGLLMSQTDADRQELCINEGVAAYLLGAPLAHGLHHTGLCVRDGADCLDHDLPLPAPLAEALLIASGHFGTRILGLTGATGSGRAALARHQLVTRTETVIDIDLTRLAQTGGPAQHLRQAILMAAIADSSLLLRGAVAPELAQAMQDSLQSATGLRVPTVVLSPTRQDLVTLCPDACEVAVPDLGVPERKQVWDYHLKRRHLTAATQAVWETADLFALNFAAIAQATDALALLEVAGGRIADAQLRAAARAQSSYAFGTGAEQVTDSYDIDDLVLAAPVRDRIDDFIAATRHRRTVYETWGMQRRLGPARGLAAMFTGASGTGKSMAASVIAKALGLDLFRIELSAIISKYIGETEKNLDAIFNAARAANAILFFDEADALFGKRSEVKDAHDRYANIECAYLLQKMERHDGIMILTTNMPRGLDAAFSRRIQFVIDFPRPDAALREKLWQGMFPAGVPLAPDVDFAFLACNFENTGGEIRNIALDAALRTASQPGASITMQCLLKAVERQMIKQGRAPTAAVFKQHFKLVQQTAT